MAFYLVIASVVGLVIFMFAEIAAGMRLAAWAFRVAVPVLRRAETWTPRLADFEAGRIYTTSHARFRLQPGGEVDFLRSYRAFGPSVALLGRLRFESGRCRVTLGLPLGVGLWFFLFTLAALSFAALHRDTTLLQPAGYGVLFLIAYFVVFPLVMRQSAWRAYEEVRACLLTGTVEDSRERELLAELRAQGDGASTIATTKLRWAGWLLIVAGLPGLPFTTAAGVGLLKRKPWAWSGAILLSVFGVAGSLLFPPFLLYRAPRTPYTEVQAAVLAGYLILWIAMFVLLLPSSVRIACGVARSETRGVFWAGVALVAFMLGMFALAYATYPHVG